MLLGEKLQIALLQGPPGMGKSELAIAFGNNYFDTYFLIWTIESETPQKMLQSYQALARHLGIYFDPKDPLEIVCSSVYRFLEKHDNKKPYLLIFDNAEQTPPLPARGHGAILLTSREKFSGIPRLSVGPFTEKEALELFTKIVKKPNPADISVIKALDFYPLAVTQAAYYIAETPGMTAERYLNLLRQNQEAVIKAMSPTTRYQKSLAMAWELTFQKLQEVHPSALQWLQIIAYLSPDGIPATWIEFFFQKVEPDPIGRQLKKNDLLKTLRDRALIRYDETNDQMLVHRLEQTLLRATLSPAQKEIAEANVLNFLEEIIKNLDHNDPTHWATYELLEPHLLNVTTHFSNPPSQLMGMIERFGCFKYKIGHLREALALLEKIAAFRRARKEEKVALPRILNVIGHVTTDLGEAEKGKVILEEALKIGKELFSLGKHPDIAQSLNNLGKAYSKLGDNKKAIEYHKGALQMREELYPSGKHLDIAWSLHNLGNTYRRLGDNEKLVEYHKKSIECHLRALQIRKELFPSEKHPDIAYSLNSLGNAYRRLQGADKLAIKYFELALQMRKELFPSGKHPDIAASLNNLGEVYEKLKNSDKAIEYFKGALEIGKETLGENHPFTQGIIRNLQLAELVKDWDIIEDKEENP